MKIHNVALLTTGVHLCKTYFKINVVFLLFNIFLHSVTFQSLYTFVFIFKCQLISVNPWLVRLVLKSPNTQVCAKVL